MSDFVKPVMGDLAVCRRLLGQVRPYWVHIFGVFVVGLLGLPLPLLAPLPLKIAVDSAVGSHPLPHLLDRLLPTNVPRTPTSILLVAVAMLVLIGVLEKLQQLAGWVYQTYVGEKLVLEFRGQLFNHAQRLSLTYHEMKGTGDSLYRIVHDAPSIQYVTVFGLLPLLNSILVLVSMVVVTATINLKLALVALAIVPILFALIMHSRKDLNSRWDRVKNLDSAAVSVLQEVLSAIRVVKAFGKESHEQRRYLGHASEGVSEQVDLALATSRFYLWVGALIALGTASALYALPLVRARGDITFRNVTFEYDSGSPVLRDITLDVPAGTLVGIAGSTGAGKTTLVNLLSRLYDPIAGEITLDGVDLRDYKVEDLRSQFAVMLQDPVLFSTTIAENIAYARPDAREDQIIEAAKAANAHDFISCLPEGYHTRVGERGTRLSGGERQRVSLARAFLKDAPILILDEPTSSVDVETEAGIMEAMTRLMSERTTFMIAHRLSTLENCTLRLHIQC